MAAHDIMEQSAIEVAEPKVNIDVGNHGSHGSHSNASSPQMASEGHVSERDGNKNNGFNTTSDRGDTPPATNGRRISDNSSSNTIHVNGRDHSKSTSLTPPPTVDSREDTPKQHPSPDRQEVKRRRVGGGFTIINSDPTRDALHAPDQQHPVQSLPRPQQAVDPRIATEPLPGTRPTRILLGFWKPSSEASIRDRHAVYGILGQNDMFRVKVVRETRDGRFVDGNFPSGAGALWIAYEDVEFEDHLKPLTRQEIKEYCRIRQYQLDHGEAAEDRNFNESQAICGAQARAGAAMFKQPSQTIVPAYGTIPPDRTSTSDHANGRSGHGGHVLRHARHVDPKQEVRPLRHPLPDVESRGGGHSDNAAAYERTQHIALREIGRANSTHGRADRHATSRELAAAVATDAANAVAASVSVPFPMYVNDRPRYQGPEDNRRLNRIWERQDSMRAKSGADDAKFYDGIKYERKPTGPFMGKLVSQGTIINIDGDDYVEYRVLTKPSFF